MIISLLVHAQEYYVIELYRSTSLRLVCLGYCLSANLPAIPAVEKKNYQNPFITFLTMDHSI